MHNLAGKAGANTDPRQQSTIIPVFSRGQREAQRNHRQSFAITPVSRGFLRSDGNPHGLSLYPTVVRSSSVGVPTRMHCSCRNPHGNTLLVFHGLPRLFHGNPHRHPRFPWESLQTHVVFRGSAYTGSHAPRTSGASHGLRWSPAGIITGIHGLPRCAARIPTVFRCIPRSFAGPCGNLHCHTRWLLRGFHRGPHGNPRKKR